MEWDTLIISLARKRCRMVGAEFDDLFQEGRAEVLTKYLVGEVPTELDIVNAMRRYLRAVREVREVVYDPPLSSIFSVPS